MCITKNTAIMTLQATNKVQDICSFKWRKWAHTQDPVVPEAAHPERIKQSHEFVTVYARDQLTNQS